ncbi:Hypothetical predicted protein [Lecanosticta acicola]|uniref:Uncharacterized protein n=1 Tax=Lecanosticta acicola TaxID=111012 RepID=A0AAI8YY03_9PEZI|nr:Hypothetical predicted protein [Lecanosticta acicola]
MASSPSTSRRDSHRTLAPILRLPLELRQAIYSYLLPAENVSHPLPSVGITSVSNRPPSSSLLNIYPTLTDEILDYFYQISTWKLVFSHAFNFFRVDPELRRLEQSPSLASIRKVEVVFFCDILLLQNYPSFGIESFCEEIRRRASRACDVLNQAPKLRTVVVSWCDSTQTGNWPEKAKILTPLKKLNCDGMARRDRPVTFKIGKINGQEDLKREDFVAALRDVLGPDQQLDAGSEGTDDPSSSLRMLAFDVRQERHRLSSNPGSIPVAVGRSGWKGAPPLMEAPLEEEEEEKDVEDSDPLPDVSSSSN